MPLLPPRQAGPAQQARQRPPQPTRPPQRLSLVPRGTLRLPVRPHLATLQLTSHFPEPEAARDPSQPSCGQQGELGTRSYWGVSGGRPGVRDKCRVLPPPPQGPLPLQVCVSGCSEGSWLEPPLPPWTTGHSPWVGLPSTWAGAEGAVPAPAPALGTEDQPGAARAEAEPCQSREQSPVGGWGAGGPPAPPLARALAPQLNRPPAPEQQGARLGGNGHPFPLGPRGSGGAPSTCWAQCKGRLPRGAHDVSSRWPGARWTLTLTQKRGQAFPTSPCAVPGPLFPLSSWSPRFRNAATVRG